MFKVFVNDKPADHQGFPEYADNPDFVCAEFHTFEQAQAYAGHFYGDWDNMDLELNIPYEYEGDVVEIRSFNEGQLDLFKDNV